MDFAPPPRVLTIRDSVRDFVQREVLPIEAEVRHRGFAAMLPVLAEKRRRARETGLWAAFSPRPREVPASRWSSSRT